MVDLTGLCARPVGNFPYAQSYKVGDIVRFTTAPGGDWLLCAGGSYNRSDYPSLFAVLSSSAAAVLSVLLTSGTAWTVPGSFSLTNKVEVVGGGGAGGWGDSSGTAGSGGGGGGFSSISNLILTPGASVPYSVGAGGMQETSYGAGYPAAAGPTFFNGSALSNSSVGANPGARGSRSGGNSGGAGGSTSGAVGSNVFAGGAGTYTGGGSAGPAGAGAAGSGQTVGVAGAGTWGDGNLYSGSGGTQNPSGSGSTVNTGVAGLAYGGGGGGGAGGSSTTTGGPGYQGVILVTWANTKFSVPNLTTSLPTGAYYIKAR